MSTPTSAPETLMRGELIHRPSPETVRDTRIEAFRAKVEVRESLRIASYVDLWRWSVQYPDRFWRSVIDDFDLRIDDLGTILDAAGAGRARWLPGASLSYAEHALRHDMDRPAVVGVSQTRGRVELQMAELRDAVARCRQGLRELGVTAGDRVVAYMPNIPETVIAFLATASLGAVWASCPPEFGPTAVIDRLAQIEPTVLITIDGYRYGDQDIDRRTAVSAIQAGLPTLRHTVMLDYLSHGETHGYIRWTELLERYAPLAFERVPFDHPLYVLFSSGTTGLPKAIVHGHGGILLEHAKALGLQNDVRHGDIFFWQSTTGWMVWNYAVSALIHGATMVCFDGHPARPATDALWRLALEESVTYFGTSAGHIMGSAASGLDSRLAEGLKQSLRGIGSTGSPLAAAGFQWVARTFGPSILLSSVSGGTDICSALVGGSPLCEVRAGEISAPTLGCDVAALDGDGRRLTGEFGELSVLAPMPSMPVRLWGDEDGSRLTSTYFNRHEGVWSHGDWVLFHEDFSCVISGRSDSTLNRGGVRLGTSDFYSITDQMPGVTDALVVYLDRAAGDELVLLVATDLNGEQWDALHAQIRQQLRTELSPRHVPDRIIPLERLPRTLSGKRLEIPVKKILLGSPPESVVSRESVSWPDALDRIHQLARAGHQPDPKEGPV